jgi:hypothetical protein
MNQLPFKDVAEMTVAAELIAQSKTLGAQNRAEGFIVLAICHQEGWSWLQFRETYHYYCGQISKKAEAMLRDFNRAGGTHRMLERSPTRAAISVEYLGQRVEREFTWDQAKQEPFVYDGRPAEQMSALSLPEDKRTLKAKYRTPHSREQMLWARLVSDVVRFVCPEASSGCYTPEEVSDFDGATEERTDTTPTATPTPISGEEAAKRMAAMAPVTIPAFTPAPVATGPVKSQVSFTATEVSDPDPNPFAIAAAQEAVREDFSKCPIECEIFGKPWAEFAVDELQTAMQTVHPDLKPGHYDAIRAVLTSKGIAA